MHGVVLPTIQQTTSLVKSFHQRQFRCCVKERSKVKKLQNAGLFAGITINAETGIVENPVVQGLARGIVALGNFVKRHAAMLLIAFIAMFGMSAFAQSTDATTIATDAQTAFSTIAPITITIAGFYVILKLAKRVVH